MLNLFIASERNRKFNEGSETLKLLVKFLKFTNWTDVKSNAQKWKVVQQVHEIWRRENLHGKVSQEHDIVKKPVDLYKKEENVEIETSTTSNTQRIESEDAANSSETIPLERVFIVNFVTRD